LKGTNKHEFPGLRATGSRAGCSVQMFKQISAPEDM
jgi:hypothetical protein